MSLLAIGIRWRLVTLIVLMIVPIAMLIFSNVRAERSRMIADAQGEILGQARLVASVHDQLLHAVERLLAELSLDPALADYDSPACGDAVARLTAAHPAYSNIAVSDLTGIVRCSANPAGVGSLVADRPYYQQALATGSLSTSGYLFGRISQKPVDVFAMPVFGPSGRAVGVVELSLDIAWLGGLISDQGLQEDVQTTVLGTDGLVLVRVPADEVTTGSSVAGEPWTAAVLATEGARNEEIQETGKPVALGAVVPLGALSGVVPGYVLVTTPKDAAFAAAEQNFLRGMVAVVAVGVVGLAWAWSISTLSVHRPVRALLQAAREYGRGDFKARVGISRLSSGEMTELAEAFESMATAVAEGQAVLLRTATTDALTGLPNRVEFTRLLEEQLVASPNGVRAEVMVQLREFSAVNATFGFEGGDLLLQQVALRLTETSGGATLIGRTDSDEFGVMVAEPDPTGGEDVAARLVAVFGQPFHLDDAPVYLAAVAGIARYPQDGHTAVDLQRRATLAQRRALLGSRDVVDYEAERDEPRADQVKLLSALREAVDAGELELHYQPKVDLARQRVIGAEALMRWRRADGTPVSPADFIPLAEQTGFIRVLTAWALEGVARQAREWHDLGLPLTIGVNISAADFEDPLLEARLQALRETWQLPDGAIDIEITESSLMANADEAAVVCHRLRALGFTIAIDDFGTGYSPLVYLQRLPVTSIKIDRSFITEADTNVRSRHIVENTLMLARRLGLVTVAEGIENAGVHDVMQSLGCDVGQGYHFARAMPADEFLTWVRESPLGLGVPDARSAG